MPVALLVEDHAATRRLFRDILRVCFDVVEAESAETATELLEHHSPDLIILDIQLPGMDGLAFLRQLRRDPVRGTIPVVVTSAHAPPHDIREAMAWGCREYVPKPLTDDPLDFAERMAALAVEGR